MKHEWRAVSSTVRRCIVCGVQQHRTTKHRWGRLVGYRWRPLAGRCKVPPVGKPLVEIL